MTATPTEPAVTLTDWDGSVSTGESHGFRVRITGLSLTRSYQVRLYRENPDDLFGFAVGCTSDLSSVGVSVGANSFIGTYTLYGCSPTPLVATGVTTGVEAAVVLADSGVDRILLREKVKVTPSIDVEPRPLRKARLNWQEVPSAQGYLLQFREKGSTSWPASSDQSGIGTVLAPSSSIDIELDRIIRPPSPGGSCG